jgi:hypothetical protein
MSRRRVFPFRRLRRSPTRLFHLILIPSNSICRSSPFSYCIPHLPLPFKNHLISSFSHFSPLVLLYSSHIFLSSFLCSFVLTLSCVAILSRIRSVSLSPSGRSPSGSEGKKKRGKRGKIRERIGASSEHRVQRLLFSQSISQSIRVVALFQARRARRGGRGTRKTTTTDDFSTHFSCPVCGSKLFRCCCVGAKLKAQDQEATVFLSPSLSRIDEENHDGEQRLRCRRKEAHEAP